MFMSRPRSTSESTKSRAGLVEDEEENVGEAETKGLCKCSFDKCTIISTLATIVLVGLMVIGLDISISQWRRSGELAYYRSYANGTYKLHGTPEEYAIFHPLEHMDARVEEIDFNYVQLDISDLFLTFRYAYRPTVIKLTNMRFVGKVSKRLRNEFSSWSYMRNSNPELIVEFNQSIGPFTTFQVDQCDNCVLNASNPDDLSQFQHKDCLKSVFLLPQSMSYLYPKPDHWDYEDGRIKVKVFGWNFVEFSQGSSSLTSMHKNSEQILQEVLKIPIYLKELHLRECEIKLSTLLKFQSSLTNLTLDNVNVTGGTGRLSEIFSSFRNLNKLTLKFGYWEELDGINSSTFKHQATSKLGTENRNPYTVDLTDLPSSLRILRLSNVILRSQNFKKPVTNLHLNLSLLVIHGTIIEDQESWNMLHDSNFVQCEQFAFQNVNNGAAEKIYSDLPHVQATMPWLTHSFLESKMDVQQTTKWIFLDNMVPLVSDEQEAVNDFDNKKEGHETMMEYLTRHGASSNVMLSSALLLHAEAQSNTSGTVQWKVRDIKNHVERSSMWFKLLNVGVFLDRNWITTSKW